MTIALVVAVIVLAAGFLGLLYLMFTREAPAEAGEATANPRLEKLAQDLNDALERMQRESRRNAFLAELTASIDFDHVLRRTLEAATEVPGIDAAVLTLAAHDSSGPLVTSVGLSPEEAEKHGMSGPPDGSQARSIAIAYRYGEEEPEDGDAIRSGLAVPLLADGEGVGFLAVFVRSPERRLGEPDVRDLEELARYAGPAIQNARRFREARQLADMDALTQLHNRRYFHETLAREVARAHRYHRPLTLIVLDLDDFKAVNDRIGHLAGDGVLAAVAERIRAVVRSADIACRVGGDEFAVILPESTLADADALYRRLQEDVSSRPIPQGGRLSFSAGVTQLRADDAADVFFERADDALYRAKGEGKGRVEAASG